MNIKKIKGIIKLFRVKHYIKNLIIFIPLIFSGNLLNYRLFFTVLFSMIGFCLMCSIVYMINDIKDIENDRNSELKRDRPIASGLISVNFALVLCAVSFVAFFLLSYVRVLEGELRTKQSIFITIGYPLIYLILNLFYSFKLKNVPVLDIIIISIGFLLRVLYGGVIIQVEISKWVYLTVITGSLYLALGKRKNELKFFGATGRKSLRGYTAEFLDKNMYMCLGLCLAFYALACIDVNTQIASMGVDLLWSVPIVLFISLRYNMNIEENKDGDPTNIILGDKFLLLSTIFLVAGILLTIYIL